MLYRIYRLQGGEVNSRVCGLQQEPQYFLGKNAMQK